METTEEDGDIISGKAEKVSKDKTEEVINLSVKDDNELESEESKEEVRGKNRITVIELIFVIIENLIAVRVAFKFLGLESSSSYVSFVYKLSAILVNPFLNAFPKLSVLSESSLLEGGSILAVVLLIGLQKLIVYLLQRN